MRNRKYKANPFKDPMDTMLESIIWEEHRSKIIPYEDEKLRPCLKCRKMIKSRKHIRICAGCRERCRNR